MELSLKLPSIRDALHAIESWRERRLVDDAPLISGGHEAGIFDKDMTVSTVCKVSKKKKNAEHLFLFTLLSRGSTVIEIGTNIGVSGAYIATALQRSSSNWHLHTIESSPYRIELARQMHANLGLNNVSYHQGLFYDQLPTVVSKLTTPVDVAFIDGQHQYQPTLDFFDIIYPYMSQAALVVFDDIEWSEGMKDAWAHVKQDQRILFATEIDGVGFTIVSGQRRAFD